MRCCGNSRAASSEPPSFFLVCLIDAIHIVSMLSIIRTRTTGGCHGSRTEDPGARGVLQEDRRRKSLGAVERDGRPDHAGAEKRLTAASMEARRDPRLYDRGRQTDH